MADRPGATYTGTVWEDVMASRAGTVRKPVAVEEYVECKARVRERLGHLTEKVNGLQDGNSWTA